MAVTGSPDLGESSLVNNRIKGAVKTAFDFFVARATNETDVSRLIPENVKHVVVSIRNILPAILEPFQHDRRMSFKIWSGPTENLAFQAGTMFFPTVEFENLTKWGTLTPRSPQMVNSNGSEFQYIGQDKIKYVYDHAERIIDVSSIPVGTLIIYNHGEVSRAFVSTVKEEIKKRLMSNGEIARMKRKLSRSLLQAELVLVTGKIANIIGNPGNVIKEVKNALREDESDRIDVNKLIKFKILGIIGNPKRGKLEKSAGRNVLLVREGRFVAGIVKEFKFTNLKTSINEVNYTIGDTKVSPSEEIYLISSRFTLQMVDDLITSLTNEVQESLSIKVIQLLLINMAKWSERKAKLGE